jgi:hypothetical protein
VWAQDCNDSGCYGAAIESNGLSSCNFAFSSCQRRKLKNAGVLQGQQVQSMSRLVLNTENLFYAQPLFAFSGMNKLTYSTCIESLEVSYRVMLFHLSTSTSIRAVDDLQSS